MTKAESDYHRDYAAKNRAKVREITRYAMRRMRLRNAMLAVIERIRARAV